MKRISTLAILALAPAFCAANQPSYQNLADLKPEIAEASFLQAAPAAKRVGGKLTITTSSGPVTFEDHLVSGERYGKELLLGYYSVSWDRVDYIIQHTYYEGRSYTILNGKTGARVSVPGNPVLSPDHTRYVSANLDLEAGFDPNVIVILRADDFSKEKTVPFPLIPPGPFSGPSDVLWISSHQIFFIKRTIKDGQYQKPIPMTIEFNEGQWQEPRILQ